MEHVFKNEPDDFDIKLEVDHLFENETESKDDFDIKLEVEHDYPENISHQYEAKCEQCDYKTSVPRYLQQHIKTIHRGVKYLCEICNHKYSSRTSLSGHIKSVHGGVKFNCEQCDYKATNPGNLQQHVKSVRLGALNKTLSKIVISRPISQ